MKLITPALTAIIICISLTRLNAQVELIPFGGYIFKASFGVINGSATISGAPAFGLNVSVPFKYEDGSIDFTYQRQDSKIVVFANDKHGYPYGDTLSVGINCLLAGACYEGGNTKGTVIPYGGMNVGVGLMDAKDEAGTVVPFVFGFKAGLKLFQSARIGFRLQSEVNIMVMFEGSGFGCMVSSTGGGCGLAISGISSAGQFGFTGGLIYRLHKSKPQPKPKTGT